MWGFPEGGMGGVTQAMRRAAEAFGATVRTSAPVERILVHGGRATGVVLEGGEEIYAETVVTTTHPKIAFLQHIERKELPEDFVTAIERWKTRSGTVKVNLALDRLPEFTSKPGFDPEVHGGTIVLAQSIGGHRRGVPGRRARTRRAPPVRRHLHPVRLRQDARPPRQARHVDVHAVGAARVGGDAGPERARCLLQSRHRSRRGARPRLQELDPPSASRSAPTRWRASTGSSAGTSFTASSP